LDDDGKVITEGMNTARMPKEIVTARMEEIMKRGMA
jgi:hypothetical protein